MIWAGRPAVDPVIADAERGQDFIADRAGIGRRLVDAVMRAEQFDRGAGAQLLQGLRRSLPRSIGRAATLRLFHGGD